MFAICLESGDRKAWVGYKSTPVHLMWVPYEATGEAMLFRSIGVAERYAMDNVVGPNLVGVLYAVDSTTGRGLADCEAFPICQKAKPRPTHAAALTLLIGSKSYRVTVSRPDRHADGSLRSLVELSYAGKRYHVATIDNRHVHPRFLRHQCDCGDYTFRREDDPRGCKHLRALVDVGLLEPIR